MMNGGSVAGSEVQAAVKAKVTRALASVSRANRKGIRRTPGRARVRRGLDPREGGTEG